MFTDLLGVAAAGPGRPFDVGVFPRVRLPTIVLEIVLGIVIGPSGVGWASLMRSWPGTAVPARTGALWPGGQRRAAPS